MDDADAIRGMSDAEMDELGQAFASLAVIADAALRARKLRELGDVEQAHAWEAYLDARWALLYPDGGMGLPGPALECGTMRAQHAVELLVRCKATVDAALKGGAS